MQRGRKKVGRVCESKSGKVILRKKIFVIRSYQNHQNVLNIHMKGSYILIARKLEQMREQLI
jgi:hypothetical protein